MALFCLGRNSTACPDSVLSIIFLRGIMYFPPQSLAAVVYEKARSHPYKWRYSFHSQELHLEIILALGAYYRTKNPMEVTSCGDISPESKHPAFYRHFTYTWEALVYFRVWGRSLKKETTSPFWWLAPRICCMRLIANQNHCQVRNCASLKAALTTATTLHMMTPQPGGFPLRGFS